MKKLGGNVLQSSITCWPWDPEQGSGVLAPGTYWVCAWAIWVRPRLGLCQVPGPALDCCSQCSLGRWGQTDWPDPHSALPVILDRNVLDPESASLSSRARAVP